MGCRGPEASPDRVQIKRVDRQMADMAGGDALDQRPARLLDVQPQVGTHDAPDALAIAE